MIVKGKKEENIRFYKSDIENESLPNQQKSKRYSFYLLTKPILSNFGDLSINYFRVTLRPTFLLGSLEKEIPKKAKKNRKRKTNEKKNEDQKTDIQELRENSNETEMSTTVTEIERIYKILKRFFKKFKRPICLYEFMINPKSFCRTIENIFYVSFLIKDGYSRIYLDKENLPVIGKVKKNTK